MSHDPTALRDFAVDPLTERLRGATHYGQRIDVPYLSHVEGNLWQGGCATGLLLPAEILHVVSLYKWERYTVRHELRSFTEVTMYDSLEQGFDQVEELAAKVAMCCADAPTLVHCQAGLNRSGLVAARALMLMGRSAQDAIELLRERRANPDGSSAVLCNPAFVAHLVSL